MAEEGFLFPASSTLGRRQSTEKWFSSFSNCPSSKPIFPFHKIKLLSLQGQQLFFCLFLKLRERSYTKRNCSTPKALLRLKKEKALQKPEVMLLNFIGTIDDLKSFCSRTSGQFFYLTGQRRGGYFHQLHCLICLMKHFYAKRGN